jgi:hypothetical protein
MLYRGVFAWAIESTICGLARLAQPLGFDCFFTPSRMWHGDGAGWLAWTRTESGAVVAVGRGEVVFSRR